MRRLLDQLLKSRPTAETLLDVGAGTGLLVAEARARGLKAEGVEPSRWCVETALAVNQVDLLCGTVQELRDRLGRYDLLTLIDVIEHTVDPAGLLREAAALLSPAACCSS
jgi:2-polyprenyl-3-methyl-5-hydroxy-6-metoxy-1,4-benzoquinol methylase